MKHWLFENVKKTIISNFKLWNKLIDSIDTQVISSCIYWFRSIDPKLISTCVIKLCKCYFAILYRLKNSLYIIGTYDRLVALISRIVRDLKVIMLFTVTRIWCIYSYCLADSRTDGSVCATPLNYAVTSARHNNHNSRTSSCILCTFFMIIFLKKKKKCKTFILSNGRRRKSVITFF